LGNGFVAHERHIAAGIVGAVAGDVDGAASGLVGCAAQLARGEFDRAADRRAVHERSWRLKQAIAKTFGRLGIANHRPVDHDPL
jgi:hypothetical protein